MIPVKKRAKGVPKRKKGLRLVAYRPDPVRSDIVIYIEKRIGQTIKNPSTSEAQRIMAGQELEHYKKKYSSTISASQQEIIRRLEEALEKIDIAKLKVLLNQHTCHLKGEFHYE